MIYDLSQTDESVFDGISERAFMESEDNLCDVCGEVHNIYDECPPENDES